LTEAEWEYAARAGTVTAYSFGATISPSQANYVGNPGPIQPVGSYAANRFGLHDMHGNVSEWVQDCYVASYPPGSGDASVAVTTGDCSRRVLRGGSGFDTPQNLRAAKRDWSTPGNRNYVSLGFRLARTPGS
jgi:formylglycine-generating enzyme required for sulfatase activity